MLKKIHRDQVIALAMALATILLFAAGYSCRINGALSAVRAASECAGFWLVGANMGLILDHYLFATLDREHFQRDRIEQVRRGLMLGIGVAGMVVLRHQWGAA